VAAGLWLFIWVVVVVVVVVAANVGGRPESFAFMVCRGLGFIELADWMETGAFWSVSYRVISDTYKGVLSYFSLNVVLVT
jgi:hypothetical protein